VFACRTHARGLAAGLPRQDHVWNTIEQLIRFHKNKHDEMRCDSSIYARLFRTQPNPTLRWGWVFLERTRILSGIQFTTHFIEIFVVETKRFVGSFSNVILTRKRPALEQDLGEQTPSAGKLFF